MDRVSSLLVGILLGAAIGGGLAWRVQSAADAASAAAREDAAALRTERDRLRAELDVAEARLVRAERELERVREIAEDTPAAKAARARRAAVLASQKEELLRLLAADAPPTEPRP
jgi:hypothetical protein